MGLLIAGIAVFLGIHLVAVVGLRDRAAAALGEGPWKGLYSLLSIVGLGLIVWGYGPARAASAVVYVPPVWTRHMALLLMLPAFVLVFAAYLPGRIKRAAGGHPMVLGAALWATAHLLANGMLHELVLFGSVLGWAVVEFVSLRSRPVRPVPGAPPGPANDVLAIVGGIAAYCAFLFGVHQWLFGVAPVAM